MYDWLSNVAGLFGCMPGKEWNKVNPIVGKSKVRRVEIQLLRHLFQCYVKVVQVQTFIYT